MDDSENRKLILEKLDCNLLVEAAAGTGKTSSIVGRMVNLIATGSCKIDTLVAATFTRKAAAELRERFHSQLRTAAKDSKRTKTQRKLLEVASQRIEQAFIGTFHSFCSLMLRERPIEFGVNPGFREIEDAENEALRNQAWKMFLADLYSSNDPRLDQINELGLKTQDLRSCFDQFVNFADVESWPHELPAPLDLQKLQAQTREYVEHMKSLIPLFPQDRKNDTLMAKYESLVLASEHTDWRERGAFFDLLTAFKSAKAVQKQWHDPKVAKQEGERYTEFNKHVVEPALKWWYETRYSFMIELLQAANEVYIRLRQNVGGLDFQDLLIQVASGLKTQSHLRSYFQQRFSHLLVDEFQDTDPLQAEILAYLCSTNHQGCDWRKCKPSPGRLFLVGDPKQSIYRFRRADIVAYLQIKKVFAASGGKIVTLSKNFRSVSELREWINTTFERIFPQCENIYSPRSVAMQQGRTDKLQNDKRQNDKLQNQARGVYKIVVPAGNKEEARLWEARQIARYILHCLQGGMTLPRTESELKLGKTEAVEPGDFLIVSRKKESLAAFAKALDDLGIPNEVTGSNALKAVAELTLMVDCLKAIDDVRNPIHYLAVLRSELFGFGDDDLYQLKKHGGTFSYTAPIPETLSAELRVRFEDVKARFCLYRNWLRGLPFTSAFGKIASDLGLVARCAVGQDGNIVAGGFMKATEKLQSESWNFDSAQDLVSFLENLQGNSETGSCSVLPTQGSAVRIMNLHKAKGLEAPVVFLTTPSDKMGSLKSNSHVDRQAENAAGYMVLAKWVGYQQQTIAQPNGWERWEAEERNFAVAEQNRLLYVACTRAACQLIVSTDGSNSEMWKDLSDDLEEVPCLEIPKSRPKTLYHAESRNHATAGKNISKSLAELKSNLVQLWNKTQVASYEIQAAKEFSLAGSVRPNWRSSGDYGQVWGTAIHRLLELKIKRPSLDLRHVAMELSREHELGSSRVQEMLETVSLVTESDIWKRAQESIQCLVEVPFESFSSQAGKPTIVRGMIDLCFEESDGWVIVDYKTDDIQAQDLSVATAHYSPQLRIYRKLWTESTGKPVKEIGIFFTKLNLYHSGI